MPIVVEVHAEDEPGCWIIHVSGEIDVATSPDLRQALREVGDRARRVTVDLSKTSFIDSSGLGVLVGACRHAREQGHEGVRLQGLQEPVRRVFEITGLTELFTVER
jgi:anti-sigma B factor antagonist